MANLVIVDEDTCKGCSLCEVACPQGVLVMDKSRVNAIGYNPMLFKHADACTGCKICALVCPDSVLTVEKGV
ncbi:MAG: 4Fe-4S binding protein [Treponema sp.]|nr:4Fe-4S binding protein [Treponema sp.]